MLSHIVKMNQEKNITQELKNNELALQVKLADIADNLAPERM